MYFTLLNYAANMRNHGDSECDINHHGKKDENELIF